MADNITKTAIFGRLTQGVMRNLEGLGKRLIDRTNIHAARRIDHSSKEVGKHVKDIGKHVDDLKATFEKNIDKLIREGKKQTSPAVLLAGAGIIGSGLAAGNYFAQKSIQAGENIADKIVPPPENIPTMNKYSMAGFYDELNKLAATGGTLYLGSSQVNTGGTKKGYGASAEMAKKNSTARINVTSPNI